MLLNMKQLLTVAKKNRFAVPAFNISDYSMFLGVMDTCERLQAPVIIEIHPHELDFTGDEITESIKAVAHKASIPVVLHLDHGDSYANCIRAIKAGFTSVMIDGSSLPFEENLAQAAKVVEAAHAADVSVEAELGTIGVTTSKEAFENQTILYTKTEDAVKFVKDSGVDTLAIAIGTSHGLYPKGMTPHLRLDILEDIEKNVAVPLVLHGGSGNPDDEIAQAVKLGISKINISSDIKNAYFTKMKEVLAETKSWEPNKIEPACIKAMSEVVEHKLRLFDTVGKASLYTLASRKLSSDEAKDVL